MAWHNVETYYYSPPDEFVLGAVRPLFTTIRDKVERSYYCRHWKRGPHLRLRFDTSPSLFASVVRPAVADIVGGYLSARPSRATLNPTELRAQHERLAELEGEAPPLFPWHPDNSIRYLGRIAEPDRPAELLADFYSVTNDIAIDITERIVTGEASRLVSAFDVMVATAHGLSSHGIARGFVSFRSHAEAFLCGFPEGQDLRRSWDRRYADRAEALADRVRAVVAALAGGPDSIPFVRRWVELVRPIKQRAVELATGDLLPLDRPGPRAANGRLEDVSPFHQALQASSRWRLTRGSVAFNAYRVLLSCTYLQLTRIGITPIQRFMLCHFAARAVEDSYQVSAMEVIRR